MIFGFNFNNIKIKISTILNCSILVASVFLSGCFVANKVEVTTKKAAKSKNNFLPFSVSNVEVINHQVVITGTNLSSVNHFVIKDGVVNTTLQIESQTSNKIIANTLSNVTFAAGKILDFILSNAEAASTFTVNFSLCDSTLGGKSFNCLITPNDKEVLSYDAASGKWKPRAVNGLSYQGAWDANDPLPTTTSSGDYFIVSDANAPYAVGDWIVYNGTTFDHINNSSAITSVFGRTTVITANEGDYVLDKMGDVDLTTAPPLTGDVLKYNGTKWVPGVVSAGSGGTVTNVTASGPLSVTNGTSTPAIAISQANTTTSGYLTNTDWNTFNNKQPAIAVGTTTQYYRGDKTWQTLDTFAVPENTNLYFTNARVLGVPLAGFTTATGSIVATDTVFAAFGKLQGQLNLKSDSATIVDWSTAGVATLEPTRLNLTSADRAVVTSATGTPVASAVTATELGHVSGVTSSIQTQLNAKQATIDKTITQDVSKLRIYGANAANYVELSAATLTGNRTLIFPDSNGTSGNVLTTDGSGILSWSAPATGGGTPSAGTVTNNEVSATANIAQSKIANLSTDLAGKEPTVTAAGNTTTYYRGDKSWQTLNTTIVPEGTNQYYTNARTIASTITAPTPTNSSIAGGDTIQVVAEKLQGQFNNILSHALTGFSTASNAVVTATDTIIGAFGKLQAQISDNITSISNKADRTNVTQTITAATITGLTTPLVGADATNKTYVDNQIAGATNQWTAGSGNVYRTSGNVGIGTTTPGATLEVAGNSILKNGTNSSSAYQFLDSAGVNALTVDTTTNQISVGTGGIKIKSSNNLTSGVLSYNSMGFSIDSNLKFTSGSTIYGAVSNANYINLGTYGTVFSTIGTANGSGNALSLVAPTYTPTFANFYTNTLLELPGIMNSTGAAILRGIHVAPVDNSAGITNTIIGIYSNVSGGTNTSSNRYAGLFTGGNVGIGSTTPQAQLTVNTAPVNGVNYGAGQTQGSGILIDNGTPVLGMTLSGGNRGANGNLGFASNLLGVNTFYDYSSDTLKRYGTSGGFTNAMAISMNSDVNQLGGNRMSFWTGAAGDPAERMTITSNGSVGIGTSSPSYKTHIYGASAAGGAIPLIMLEDTGADGARGFPLRIKNTSATTPSDWNFGSSGVYPYATSTVAADAFQIFNSRTTSQDFLIYGANTASANYWHFKADGSFITSARGGNVGIGTSIPNSKLEVLASNLGNNLNDVVEIQRFSGGHGVNIGMLDVRNIRTSAGNTWLNAGTRIQQKVDATWMGYIQFNGTTNDGGISFGTGQTTSAPGVNTEAMRITNGGFIGIGNIIPGYQLQLSTDSAAKPGTSTWIIASDERLKDIRAPFTRGLNDLLGLNTIYFNYKKDNALNLPSNKEYVGIKAQDVQKVIPEAVSKDKEGYLHVSNDSIIWTAINAIKELYYKLIGHDKQLEIHTRQIASKAEKSEVEQLRVENAALKARLEKIERALKLK
jgi:hypothetical protein